MWHVRRPISDEPLLFSDIHFVKHDPLQTEKRDLACASRHHNPVPNFASSLSSNQIQRMVNLVGSCERVSVPVLRTIQDNKCEPVIPKTQYGYQLYGPLGESIASTDYSKQIQDRIDQLDPEMKAQYQSLVGCNQETSIKIERRTRMQSKSAFWFEQRTFRITASNFGTFIKMKDRTDPVKTFDQKKAFFTSRSVRHGLQHEATALAQFCKTVSCVECPVGLVVNPQVPFLGASPDRLVQEGETLKLVEVKCPVSLYDKKVSIKKRVESGQFYLEKVCGQLNLKKSHDYYFQIQGQLNLTGIEECFLVVFVPPSDLEYVRIKRDCEFFSTHMLPKLSSVWFDKLLPHFVTQV